MLDVIGHDDGEVIANEGKPPMALIACAQLAEDIVGHPLPGSIKQGGNLARLRQSAREAALA